MRAKFLLMPVSALMLISSNVVADDVFVDLSVLDSLGETASPVINNGPLFPIVKKTQPAAKPAKPARKAKPVTKKAPVKKPVVSAPAEKVVIPTKAEVKVEVNLPEEVKTPVEETINKPIIAEDLADSPFAVAPVEAVKEEISAAPIAPVEVKVEELTDAEKEPVIMEPINGATLMPSAEEDTPTVSGMPESLFDTPVEPAQPVVENAAPAPEAVAPLLDKTIAPQAPVVTENPAGPSNEVIFEPDSYDLTEADKANLDKLVASFENPAANKIAIYAFNVNDGKDVFRKKRLSLNRAVEVRSYLLSKGYKNYSIKVINIDEADDKENKVIVEELK